MYILMKRTCYCEHKNQGGYFAATCEFCRAIKNNFILLMKNETIYYKPRAYQSIGLWSKVTAEQWNDANWQKQHAIRTVDQLARVIKLNPFQESEIRRTVETLRQQGKEPLRITPYYATLMDADPWNPRLKFGHKSKKRLDPVFWQSVPTPANLLFPNTGREASMCENSRSFGAAYQRYPNRVALFVAENTSCASYCVHCQRSKSLDKTADVDQEKIGKGLFYISYNKNIDEVLVTGGDALMISKKLLRHVLEELSRIRHLRAIRIATRVPVVLPMGVTDELLDLIGKSANRFNLGTEKYVYFMTHINHYHEITSDLAVAVKKIRKHGFTVRNQTVLLNHVNDDYLTLAETFRRMFWIGVHPYYLLQCHKEKGIAHFITPIQLGKIYMQNLQGWISGVTIPRYAVNVEGGGGKVFLMPSGHDTVHSGKKLDGEIAGSAAPVTTWDGKIIQNYESLGRATETEFENAVAIMDRFIGRPGVFVPKLILVDEAGNFLGTTNRKRLPKLGKIKKSSALNYKIHHKNMPITNPVVVARKLEKEYLKSKLVKPGFSGLKLVSGQDR